MRGQLAAEFKIAALAERQGGVVARAQLIALGLSVSAIDRRVRAGRLHGLYRGVYAVGHRRLDVVGRRWAVVLACGAGAVISHTSAAAAYGLVRSSAAAVDVTVRAGAVRRPGIRLHWGRLDPDEVTKLEGLPITTPARTLLDLAAGGLRGRRLEAALDAAERQRGIDWNSLRVLLGRHGGRPGVRALGETLARYAPGEVETLSVLEEIVLELCDAHAIPRPHVNAVVAGRRRDFYWPQARLVVEADSYTWHRSPSALDDDRERDVELAIAGLRGLRFTYAQCTRRPRYVASALLSALGRELTSLSDVKSRPRRRAAGGRP